MTTPRTSLLAAFAAAFLTLGTVSAEAQNLFGLKAGTNFSTLAVDEDEIDDADFRTGFTVGIYKQVPIGKLVTFQSEALFTQKGATYDLTGRDVEAKLSYLEIPLSLQVRIPATPVKVYVGGSAGYLLNAKYEYASDFFENGQDVFEYDDMDGFNRFEFSGLAGVGVQLGAVMLDARVTRGFSNVEDDRTVGALPLEGNDTKNFGISLTAGFAF